MSDADHGTVEVRKEPLNLIRVTPKKDDPATVDMARWAEGWLNHDIEKKIMHFVKYGYFPND